MPAKVTLEVASGPIQGKVFTFDGHDTFLFGRHRECHARLPKDECVSRHHFLLEVNPPDARIRDLGSLNGTIINGVKHGGRSPHELPEDVAGREFPVCDLENGDEIIVGKTTIAVRVEIPSICTKCGVEVPTDPTEEAARESEGVLCPSCRLNVKDEPKDVGDLATARCERCGRDVMSETSSARDGEYLCQACRHEMTSNMAGLQQLLQAAKDQDQARPDVEGYDIDQELGKGGMGVVYRARRDPGGHLVAIKLLLAKVAVSERARKMFQREIEVAKQLRHPNIVRFVDHGSSGGAFFCVLEYCNHGSLSALLKRYGPLTLKTAAPLMLQCLIGLAFAHKYNFVHRDLKPQNILLHKHEGNIVAKITDFGLAKSFETAGLSGMTATGTLGGTFYYMPREQLTNFKYVHPSSDVWGIGATFYKMLTGEYPLDFPENRDPMEVLLRDEATPIRRRAASIPKAVADVIDRALLSDTSKRYQDAAEMKTALQKALRSK